MVSIKKIVPSGGISDFRQVTPSAGNGFRLLAGAMDVAYDQLAPRAMLEQKNLADEEWRPYAKGQMAADGTVYPSSMGGGAPGPGGVAGDRPWLRYSNQGATRNKPISAALADSMGFLGDMGITMEVFSGGQDGKREGDRRTGSVRHDHGNAADVYFYRDGRRLDWGNQDDLPVFQEIVRRGKAAGVTGFGAGPGYMGQGSMHVGFGDPGVWGAEGKGANAPEWLLAAYNGAPVTGNPSRAPTITASSKGGGDATPAPTMIRTKDGSLQPRLYSPAAGPILQAYNAAAGVAYLSEVGIQSTSDFMAMSQEFALNPDGFRQAAEGYISGIVEKAPEMFRADLRAELTEEAGRRFHGLQNEKHQDTQQRAINASGARAEMLASDYAAAIAGGNPEVIAATRDKLAGVLMARESLPGLSWTPEQSWNFIRKAEDEGQAEIKKRQKEQSSAWGKAFDLIIDTYQAGRDPADDSVLFNPAARAAHPDKAREAAAFEMLAKETSFLSAPPKTKRKMIEDWTAEGISEPWQNDFLDAAIKMTATDAAAWVDDPMLRAEQVFRDDPPPPMPEFDPANPKVFEDWLKLRKSYADKLVAGEYADRPVYIKKGEAGDIGALFGKDVPPALKAMAAGVVVLALKEDATTFFNQINTTDQTVQHAGALLASTGNSTVATEIMTGQAMLDQGLSTAPSGKAVAGGLTLDMRKALGVEPGSVDLTRGNIPSMEQVQKAEWAEAPE